MLVENFANFDLRLLCEALRTENKLSLEEYLVHWNGTPCCGDRTLSEGGKER